ncbi:MAG: hypothetical protein ACI4Q6_03815 [Huintestinicola sp.]
MEEKKIMDHIKDVIGASNDVLVIAHENGQCRSIVHGNMEDIAKALFCCMHDKKNNELGDFLFHVLKLNAMNIISNNSKYAVELVSAINTVTENKINEIKGQANKKIDPKLLN